MIVGIDEVGRGCWAGPVVAGAVVLSRPIAGLRDSKLTTKKQRLLLDHAIRECALDFGLGWVSADEVDNLGLTKAVGLAMQRALDSISVQYQKIIIDGTINYLSHRSSSEAIIKADQTVAAVSAASIIAKVARDSFMVEQHRRLPHWGFDRHVGYGTEQHRRALEQYGISVLHRKSYKPVQVYL